MAKRFPDSSQLADKLHRKTMGELDLSDVFFDSLRESYPSFDAWFQKHPERECFVQYNDAGTIEGLLVLKVEAGPIVDVEPAIEASKVVKVCTFKSNPHKTRLGQRFVRLVIAAMLKHDTQYAYCTTYDKQEKLISMLEQYGFVHTGYKTDSEERVYVKNLKLIQGDVFKDYPCVSTRNSAFYCLSIKPQYHTQMFPDSRLSTECPGIIGDRSYTNSIQKIYVCAMRGVSEMKKGDILFIRRTRDTSYSSAPAYYTACVTSVCTVEDIRPALSFPTADAFFDYTKEYNPFTREEIEKYYTNKGVAIKMVYNSRLNKTVNNEALMQIMGNVDQDPIFYWGFFPIPPQNAHQILEQGEVYEGFIID